MKRVLLTVALCVAASVSFAQKKAVNEAQSIAKGSTPDFSEARTLIKGALENPETKDDAKTWYVAGFIEDQQFSNERTKQVLGQQPDEPVMYEALGSILPYFEKAYELDQLPNEKGKVKPKFTKDIKGILGANHVYYNQGVNKQGEANMINDAKQYQEELGKAKEFFKLALPYFEKAHQMKPEEREYMTALRGIYYNLNMGDKFDAIEAEMNK